MRQKKPIPKNNEKSSISTPPSIGYSILGGIFQGFTFGSGNAIAQNIFRPIPNEKKNCSELWNIYEIFCIQNSNQLLDEKDRCLQLLKEIKKDCK